MAEFNHVNVATNISVLLLFKMTDKLITYNPNDHDNMRHNDRIRNELYLWTFLDRNNMSLYDCVVSLDVKL